MEQTVSHPQRLKVTTSDILKSQELQSWHGRLSNSSKGLTYRIFKHEISFEPYLKLLHESHFLPILNFWSSNHKLPVADGKTLPIMKENVHFVKQTIWATNIIISLNVLYLKLRDINIFQHFI